MPIVTVKSSEKDVFSLNSTSGKPGYDRQPGYFSTHKYGGKEKFQHGAQTF